MSNFNTATNVQETSIYSTDQEQEIGASAAHEIEKEYKIVDDPVMNDRVDRILKRIVAVSDRKELVYVGRIIGDKKKEDRESREPVINALSLPGGYVFVFKGLMDYIKDDNQLAAVIAHEVGHVTARHSIKHLQAAYANVAAVISAIMVNSRLAGGINAATTAMFFQYSRQDELEADALGVKYMKAAGFNPQGMIRMLEKLDEHDRKQPLRPMSFGRTHPYIHQRLAAASQAITGEMTSRDWIRTTGEKP